MPNYDPKVNCQYCGLNFHQNELFPAAMIRPAIQEFIRKEKPEWLSDGFICHGDLNKFRTLYVEESSRNLVADFVAGGRPGSP